MQPSRIMIMKIRQKLSIGMLMLTALVVSIPSWGQLVDQEVLHPAIPLLDEAGHSVLETQNPYSPRITCGQCHDYESITHSYHMETGRDEADDKFGAKIGLSQLVSPGYFGGYNCMGSNNPDQLAKQNNASADDFADYGAAGIIQRCAGCHTGGGWMEKDRKGHRYDEVDPTTVAAFDGDYYNRGTNSENKKVDSSVVAKWNWQKSGVVENDCLMCHIDMSRLQVFDDQLKVEGGPDGKSLWGTLRRKKFIDDGLFRYNATAMMEYLNIKHPEGTNKDVSLVNVTKKNVQITGNSNGFNVNFDLALNENGTPKLTWNPEAFDEKGKVSIPMVSFPQNDSCMQCHRTSNSRRGFYGFGEDAAAVYDEEGMLLEDYKDDVHYGKEFTEANGETRSIETCNSCHARDYYRKSWESVDLDADHNFPKGNSEMNVHDDRDNQPNAKSCLYCHDTGPNPVVPSGHNNMAEAHLSLWKFSGDLRGYSKNMLEKVTKTHLDEVSCQACHITNKTSRGKDMQILYQYRREEDGKLRMVPYNPRARYFWKDKNSARVLTKTERNSVFTSKTTEDGSKIGVIVDTETGETLLEVSARMSHGSLRYGDPDSYNGFQALKRAYDLLLVSKGVTTPDVAMIWTEINHYLMSHNTRPSVEALECESCHRRKSNGVISSLVAPDSILGSGNVKKVTTIADPKLVDDGIIVLDMPYMKVDALGNITESVEDILYYSLVNPSMSRLNNETMPFQRGMAKKLTMVEAIKTTNVKAELHREVLSGLLKGEDTFIFKPNYGVASIRSVSIMAQSNFMLNMIMPYTSFKVSMVETGIEAANDAVNKGSKLASDILAVEFINTEGDVINELMAVDMLVILPYQGRYAAANKLQVLHSENGEIWNDLALADILAVQPVVDDMSGYIIIRTTKLGHFAIADPKGAVIPSCTLPENCGN